MLKSFLVVLLTAATAFASSGPQPKRQLHEDPDAAFDEAAREEALDEAAREAASCSTLAAPTFADLKLKKLPSIVLADLSRASLKPLNTDERNALLEAEEKGIFANWELPEAESPYTLSGLTFAKLSGVDPFGRIRFILGQHQYTLTVKDVADTSYRTSGRAAEKPIKIATKSFFAKIKDRIKNRIKSYSRKTILTVAIATVATPTVGLVGYELLKPALYENGSKDRGSHPGKVENFMKKWRAASAVEQQELFRQAIHEIHSNVVEGHDLFSYDRDPILKSDTAELLEITLKDMNPAQLLEIIRIAQPYASTTGLTAENILTRYGEVNATNQPLIFQASEALKNAHTPQAALWTKVLEARVHPNPNARFNEQDFAFIKSVLAKLDPKASSELIEKTIGVPAGDTAIFQKTALSPAQALEVLDYLTPETQKKLVIAAFSWRAAEADLSMLEKALSRPALESAQGLETIGEGFFLAHKTEMTVDLAVRLAELTGANVLSKYAHAFPEKMTKELMTKVVNDPRVKPEGRNAIVLLYCRTNGKILSIKEIVEIHNTLGTPGVLSEYAKAFPERFDFQKAMQFLNAMDEGSKTEFAKLYFARNLLTMTGEQTLALHNLIGTDDVLLNYATAHSSSISNELVQRFALQAKTPEAKNRLLKVFKVR